MSIFVCVCVFGRIDLLCFCRASTWLVIANTYTTRTYMEAQNCTTYEWSL